MNVLIAEDHTMFLEYVVSVLNELDHVQHIIPVNNGQLAFSKLHDNKIDLLITDLNLPKLNGIKLIERTRTAYPNIKIIVLTQYQNKGLIRKLKALKVDGFLTKSSSKAAFLQVLNSAFTGTFSFEKTRDSENVNSSRIEEKLLLDSFSEISSLSKRETEIIKLLLENKSNREIAHQLFIGTETVITHRKNIYRKLGVNNILDLYKLVSELK